LTEEQIKTKQARLEKNDIAKIEQELAVLKAKIKAMQKQIHNVSIKNQ